MVKGTNGSLMIPPFKRTKDFLMIPPFKRTRDFIMFSYDPSFYT